MFPWLVSLKDDHAPPNAPIVAFKRAYPVVHYDTAAFNRFASPFAAGFRAHVQDMVYSSQAEAVCVHDATHLPPHPDCDCGFYALRARNLVEQYTFAGSCHRFAGASCVLEVALYGREVVEGPRGFRAAAQQVTVVTPDSHCVACAMQASLFVPYRLWRRTDLIASFSVVPVCERCVESSEARAWSPLAPLTVSDMISLLGTSVMLRDVTTPLYHTPANRPTL